MLGLDTLVREENRDLFIKVVCRYILETGCGDFDADVRRYRKRDRGVVMVYDVESG